MTLFVQLGTQRPPCTVGLQVVGLPLEFDSLLFGELFEDLPASLFRDRRWGNAFLPKGGVDIASRLGTLTRGARDGLVLARNVLGREQWPVVTRWVLHTLQTLESGGHPFGQPDSFVLARLAEHPR